MVDIGAKPIAPFRCKLSVSPESRQSTDRRGGTQTHAWRWQAAGHGPAVESASICSNAAMRRFCWPAPWPSPETAPRIHPPGRSLVRLAPHPPPRAGWQSARLRPLRSTPAAICAWAMLSKSLPRFCTIVLDEVEIAGRDAAQLRKLGLFQPPSRAHGYGCRSDPQWHGTIDFPLFQGLLRIFFRHDCEYIYKNRFDQAPY